MSRCFPFPPPGYEKKIRIDEVDFLIKENQKKEKKHRKQKKDKEKKEGKEKKDKETHKDKHKERKDKKEEDKDRKYKDRDKEKSRASEDKKGARVLPNTSDKEKIVTSTFQNNGNGESKFIQNLARRVRDEEEATESQNPLTFPCGDKDNNISFSVPETNHGNDEKRINTHRNIPLAENEVFRVSSCTDQNGAEVMVKPVEKKEVQEMNHRKEDVTKSDKPLYNKGIKKGEPNNIKERSSKEKKEVINKTGQGKPIFVEGGPRSKERDVDTTNFRAQDFSKASIRTLATEGILGKRKNLETNGLLYENGSRPNKIQRPGASPISAVENGRKLGACVSLVKPVSELRGTVCIPEVKEHRVNSFIDSVEPKSQPPVSSVKTKENGLVSAKKQPHSDLKYLDQILNVPKREELHEVDYNEELEWIFGNSGVQLLKKQRSDATTSLDETMQVWNQALRLESADIIALPYVVPF